MGTFQDPDKVQKTIKLEIHPPLTEEERKDKASKRWKRASHSSRNKNAFDGIATVTSKLGTEHYENYGGVGKEDFHKQYFSCQAKDEKKTVLPSFNMLGRSCKYFSPNKPIVLLLSGMCVSSVF